MNNPIQSIRSRTLWTMILLVYLALLVSIGFIAFKKQYFNEAESMLGDFLKVKYTYEKQNTNEGLDALVNSIIERNSDSANDLQELASQCFNIVLGALLAFLSSSTTTLLQPSKPMPSNENDR